MMKTNRVVILRHGESEFNLLNRFCGWHDSPLSEAGMTETRCLAAVNLLKENMEFDVVYTSALCRAQHTAEMILSELKSCFVPIKTDWRLNERHYGDLTGYNKRQMADRYGEDQVQAWRRGYDCVPPPISTDNRYYYAICNNPALGDVPADQFPLTESTRMCADRIRPAWEEIKTEVMAGTRVLIVAHGTVARLLIKIIEDHSEEEISKINIPNSIPCVFEFDLKTGERIGGLTYLGDPEYIKKKAAQVAAIGK